MWTCSVRGVTIEEEGILISRCDKPYRQNLAVTSIRFPAPPNPKPMPLVVNSMSRVECRLEHDTCLDFPGHLLVLLLLIIAKRVISNAGPRYARGSRPGGRLEFARTLPFWLAGQP